MTRKPIDLVGRHVSAYVLRTGTKNEMQEVVAEGDIHVHQEGDTPEDKGVDIQGETLNLIHDPEGDLLIVFGDSRDPAQMQLDDLTLIGPEVRINQKDNTAKVEGVGAMHLPSDTTFEGTKPARPGARLTIHWTEEMFFNGKDAAFQGGVVAYQDNASLRCRTLHVSLDRKVSFLEGQNRGQGAKVERLVCSNQVDILDIKKDTGGKMIQYDRLACTELTVDNRNGPVNAAGPGRVYLLQQGTAGFQEKPDKSQKKQMFLTRVDFTGRMYSTKYPDQSRIAKFFDNVEVYHQPANDLNATVDADKLPKDGMYMRCNRLEVRGKPGTDGKTYQEMTGMGGVFCRTNEFAANADVVKYDQNQDQVIFEGKVGSVARLSRFMGQGIEPQILEGMRILYNRRTGAFSVDDAQVIQGSER